jgi:hypothetical protein
MTLEKDIEKRFVRYATKQGCYCPKFSDPARRGAPDRLIHMPGGYAFYVEFKRTNGKLSRHQLWFLQYFHKKSISCHVCYSSEDAKEILDWYMRGLVENILVGLKSSLVEIGLKFYKIFRKKILKEEK